MKLSLLGFLLILALPSSPLSAQEDFEPFDLTELPQGVMVTLPHPAQTVAPVSLQLQVQASDRAQVLKLTTLSTQGTSQKLKLAIYDQAAKGVQRFTLNPGATMLYHFKSLRPVRIVSEPALTPAQAKNQKLLLESNRPLGVSHGMSAVQSSAF